MGRYIANQAVKLLSINNIATSKAKIAILGFSFKENISDYSAFEVTAACGEKGAHAITHAIAVGTYGKSKGGINQTQNFFGRSRNRIELRWNGDYFNYALQIRSIRPYAKETNVKYHVGLLWE
jgi:hypothetical protein